VVGIGVNQVTQLDVSGDSDSAADGGGAVSSTDREGSGSDAGAARENADSPAAAAPTSGNDLLAAPIRLAPDRFGTQVARLQDVVTLARLHGDAASFSTSASASAPTDTDGAFALPQTLDELRDAYKSTCPTTGWGHGRAVPVRYGGQPGVLVFRPVRGDTQVVDLFLCGSDRPERSITLPAP
jgi:hypothetical protein